MGRVHGWGEFVNIIEQIEKESLSSWNSFNEVETILLEVPPEKIDFKIHNALVDIKKFTKKGWDKKLLKAQTALNNLIRIRAVYVESDLIAPLEGENG
jgi:hypothetical protein